MAIYPYRVDRGCFFAVTLVLTQLFLLNVYSENTSIRNPFLLTPKRVAMCEICQGFSKSSVKAQRSPHHLDTTKLSDKCVLCVQIDSKMCKMTICLRQ